MVAPPEVPPQASPPRDGKQVRKGPPEWVNKGSGAFKDGGGGSVFYGVGAASGIRNPALAQAAADDRARAEVAMCLNTFVTVLTKDYMASTTAGAPDKTAEEQHLSQSLKSFAKVTLHGASIVDHWQDPSDGTVFALAKLDLQSVRSVLERSAELDAKVRDYVRANAEKAFDELTK
jgi:hypothetical protein